MQLDQQYGIEHVFTDWREMLAHPAVLAVAEHYYHFGGRSPIGRHAGKLAPLRPDDLAGDVIREVVKRNQVDPAEISDVVLGCVNQAGEDNRNVARMALLLAGLPVEVGGLTVNRLCGSGLQAINSAAHAIAVGDGDAFIGGGVESMTRAPWVMAKPGTPWAKPAPAAPRCVRSPSGPAPAARRAGSVRSAR